MMVKLSVLAAACLPMAAAFTSPTPFAGTGHRSALQSGASPASLMHNVALRAPRAASSLPTMSMKVPKIIQGGMGVQVGLGKHKYRVPPFPRR